MRQELFDIPIDSLTFEETVGRAVESMRRRTLTQHVAINVANMTNRAVIGTGTECGLRGMVPDNDP